MMKIEIKHRFSGAVLFSHEVEGNTIKITLLAAVSAGANLRGADLRGANLEGANLEAANLEAANLGGANLRGADLRGANLEGANLEAANLEAANLGGANLVGAYLVGAYLVGAYLGGADLRGANLEAANLRGADLRGANLEGANLEAANLDNKEELTANRPIIQVGPIGSRSGYLIAYITKQGLRLRAGCFFGSKDDFLERLEAEHGDNNHAEEYKAAIQFIEVHEKLWGNNE